MLTRLATIAVITVGLLSAKDEGFNGKWVIDKGASTATCEIPDGLTQNIKKKGDGYNIETVWREPKGGVAPLVLLGILSTQFKLGADGQETPNQVGPFMQNTRTTTSGNQLVTEWSANDGQGKVVRGKWTRTLSEDGKSMTLDIEETTDGGGSGNAKLVFKRK